MGLWRRERRLAPLLARRVKEAAIAASLEAGRRVGREWRGGTGRCGNAVSPHTLRSMMPCPLAQKLGLPANRHTCLARPSASKSFPDMSVTCNVAPSKDMITREYSRYAELGTVERRRARKTTRGSD